MTVQLSWFGTVQEYEPHLSLQEARDNAASYLRHLRRQHGAGAVYPITKGEVWAIAHPSSRLSIVPCNDPRAPHCRECGCEAIHDGRGYTCDCQEPAESEEE